MNALNGKQMSENTLVYFTSDHGCHIDLGADGGSNGKFKGFTYFSLPNTVFLTKTFSFIIHRIYMETYAKKIATNVLLHSISGISNMYDHGFIYLSYLYTQNTRFDNFKMAVYKQRRQNLGLF